MNRYALTRLISSGRYLCFDVRRIYGDLKAAAGQESLPLPETQSGPAPVAGALFDLGALNHGIFFKEVLVDEDDDEAFISTRAFFPYDEDNITDGGESTSVQPDRIARILRQKGALRKGEELSQHDLNVLRVMDELPTFDPFLLLSRRQELEVERSVASGYFEITEAEWEWIRRPIRGKVAQLVNRAFLTGTPSKGSEAENQSLIRSNARMTETVVDSIWRGKPTESVAALMRSFRLDEHSIEKTLFSWKGVTYYEHLHDQNLDGMHAFADWLVSEDSKPADAAVIPSLTLDRCLSLRARARSAVRSSHKQSAGVLKLYREAFSRLVDGDDTGSFRDFLHDAPKHFVTLGATVGMLAHTVNAWRDMTRGGVQRRRNAEELTRFYDFVATVNAAPEMA
jgi:hypothetical protein